jgi:molybdopterin synthase sulfur carrier subunit
MKPIWSTSFPQSVAGSKDDAGSNGVEITRNVHGVAAWLMKEYLIELGGIEAGPDRVAGEGWKATYTRIDPYKIGSISVGRVRLDIEGEDQAIECLMPKLEMKLMRGGG